MIRLVSGILIYSVGIGVMLATGVVSLLAAVMYQGMASLIWFAATLTIPWYIHLMAVWMRETAELYAASRKEVS